MRPPTQRVSVGRDRAAWIVLFVSVVLVLGGLAGRITDPVVTRTTAAMTPRGSEGRTSASEPPPTQAPPIRLISPIPDVLWFRSGLVRIRGEADGIHRLQATVTIGPREIGAATLDVGADGGFSGWLPIVPPAVRSRAMLRLGDLAQPERELLASPLYVQAGDAVLIWSPAEPDDPVAGDRVVVSGPVLAPVGQVRVVLRDAAGRTLAEMTTAVSETAPDRAEGDVPDAHPKYHVELSLPPDSPSGQSHLYVFGLDGRTGEVVDRADTRVTLGP